VHPARRTSTVGLKARPTKMSSPRVWRGQPTNGQRSVANRRRAGRFEAALRWPALLDSVPPGVGPRPVPSAGGGGHAHHPDHTSPGGDASPHGSRASPARSNKWGAGAASGHYTVALDRHRYRVLVPWFATPRPAAHAAVAGSHNQSCVRVPGSTDTLRCRLSPKQVGRRVRTTPLQGRPRGFQCGLSSTPALARRGDTCSPCRAQYAITGRCQRHSCDDDVHRPPNIAGGAGPLEACGRYPDTLLAVAAKTKS
jgi:hypothetical protein